MKNTQERLRAYSKEIDQILNQVATGQTDPRQKVQIGSLIMDFGRVMIEDRMGDPLDEVKTGAIEQAIHINYEVATDD